MSAETDKPPDLCFQIAGFGIITLQNWILIAKTQLDPTFGNSPSEGGLEKTSRAVARVLTIRILQLRANLQSPGATYGSGKCAL